VYSSDATVLVLRMQRHLSNPHRPMPVFVPGYGVQAAPNNQLELAFGETVRGFLGESPAPPGLISTMGSPQGTTYSSWPSRRRGMCGWPGTGNEPRNSL